MGIFSFLFFFFLWRRERTRWLALKCLVALKACVQSCLCYIQSQPKAKVSHADQVKHQQVGNVCSSQWRPANWHNSRGKILQAQHHLLQRKAGKKKQDI